MQGVVIATEQIKSSSYYCCHSSRAAIYSKLKLKRVAKVTPKRGTALQFHPSTSRTLVAMGDKHGNFSLWGVVRALWISKTVHIM